MGSRTWGTKSGVTWRLHTWDHPPFVPLQVWEECPPPAAIAGLNLPVIDGEVSAKRPAKSSPSSSATRAGVPAGDEIVSDPHKTSTDDSKAATQQFSMGDGLPPVPAKVVEKILSGQFVDMAELLRDNLEVERRCNTTESASAGPVPTTS